LYEGNYNISFSLSFQKTSTGNKKVLIWLRLNSSNIPWTNREITLYNTREGSFQSYHFNYAVYLKNNDFIEVCWYSIDGTISLTSKIPTRGPQIPSAIINVYQVTYCQPGLIGAQGNQGEKGQNIMFQPLETGTITSLDESSTMVIPSNSLTNYIEIGSYLFVCNQSNPSLSGYLVVLDKIIPILPLMLGSSTNATLIVGWIYSNLNTTISWTTQSNILFLGKTVIGPKS